MAAPLDVPVGYHIAIGAPLGLRASASSSPSAPHPDPPAPPAHQARRPASYQRRRIASPRACALRGCGGPPRGCQATAPSGPAGRRTANRRQRGAAALPPPSTTGPLQSAAAGLLPLLPQRRAAVRKVAAAGAASGGRRAAARPEQRSRSGCTSPRRAPSPVGSCPLHRFASDPVSTDGCEDKVGGNATCTRDCTRRFVLMLLLLFPFSDLRSVCVALPFVFDPSSTFPKDEVVAAPSRLQRRRS